MRQLLLYGFRESLCLYVWMNCAALTALDSWLLYFRSINKIHHINPSAFPPLCYKQSAPLSFAAVCFILSFTGYFSLSQDDATNKTFGPQVLSRRSKSCNGLQEGNQWKDDERLKLPLSHSVHCWGAVCDQGATVLSCWIGRWILLWWFLTEIMWTDLREKTQTLQPVGN